MRDLSRAGADLLLIVTLLTATLWSPSARAEVEFDGSLGAGLAIYSLSRLPDRPGGTTELGVALDTRLGVLINGRFGVHVVGSLGLTAFDRGREVADKGIALGEGTTDAYETVGKWMTVEDKYQPWRFLGGMIGSAFLLFGYFGSALCFVATPFATTSFFDAGLTGSYTVQLGGLAFSSEVGIGGLLFVHPTTNSSHGGVGPLVGLALSWGRLGFSWRMLWSPPGGQSEEQDTPTHVMASVLTVNLAW